MARVVLKAGHVRPVYTGHPWVFKQAVAAVEGACEPGQEVSVVDGHGNFLGRGFYSPTSAIAVRLYTNRDHAIDAAFLRARFHRALVARRDLGLPSADTTAYRLVHGEGDALPGLIVDVFGDVACVQLNTAGIRRREGLVYDAIEQALSPRAIVDRTGEAAARIEGVPVGAGVVRGDAKLDTFSFKERGFDYSVPASLGQKTGFYLDQRALRDRVEALAMGKRVLDAYAFVGAFSLAAARGGAKHVEAIDSSPLACEIAAETARNNGYSDVITVAKQDAVHAMEDAARKGGFDLVLCDPPKLAPSRGKLDAALNAYRKITRAACRATTPGGIVVVSSCSGSVGFPELTRALAHGARDGNLRATILEEHIQAPDHPAPADFPEGLYLKSIVARVQVLD
ncbi:MAG: class I SAM-dependent rRNA methyltransferase [Polyangiaceae bacterium]|nr:class I SAM-dependent rRNA methyltransferase [Polyangiaceae bacterium]